MTCGWNEALETTSVQEGARIRSRIRRGQKNYRECVGGCGNKVWRTLRGRFIALRCADCEFEHQRKRRAKADRERRARLKLGIRLPNPALSKSNSPPAVVEGRVSRKFCHTCGSLPHRVEGERCSACGLAQREAQ